MKFSILNKNQLLDIHATSLRILSDTGIKVQVDEARDLICKAGAEMNHDGTIRIPTVLVKRALSYCSPEVLLYGRFGYPHIVIGGNRVHFGTMAYPTVVLDWKTGEYRPSLLSDLDDAVSMAESLSTMDFIMPGCCPTDVDQSRADRYMWRACLLRSRKPVFNLCYGKDGLEGLVKMICAISGDMDTFRSKPYLAIVAGAFSPLMIPENDCDVIVGAAKQGIPLILMGGPMAGATGPVTLAGNIAQLNAEMLACIVLAKVANPEVPLIYCPIPKTFDMSVTNLVTSGPEVVLQQLACLQLGKFYQLPVGGSGIICDAKAPDAQMGWECMSTGLLAAIAGMNLIVGAACIDAESILSLEALAIHHEVVGFISRIVRGFNIDEESLAEQTIMNIGPAGEFLSGDHTLKHFRNELWVPSLSIRSSYSSWQEQGSKSLRNQARDFVRRTLANPTFLKIPDGIEKQFYEIIMD